MKGGSGGREVGKEGESEVGKERGSRNQMYYIRHRIGALRST